MIESVADLPRQIRRRIPDWKREHKVLFALPVRPYPDQTEVTIFRPLTREEIQYIESTSEYMDEWWAEGWMIGHCLLYPNPYALDEWEAGAVDFLGRQILEASGWASVEAITSGLGVARQEASTLDSAILVYLLKAFPQLRLEEIQAMDFATVLRYLALAEVVIGQPLNVQMWLDPEGWEREQRRAAKREYSRPNVPSHLPSASQFKTPAEQMFTEADIRRKPALKYLPAEAAPEIEIKAAKNATQLQSSSDIMKEMAEMQDFLNGGT